MDSALFAAAGTQPLTMNNHHKGCSPSHFQSNARLAATFTLLSTNHDRTGRAFVSTIEGRGDRRPIWGVQWHPEKAVFEWGTVPDAATGRSLAYEGINHSFEAQALTRYTAGFFLAHARRSGHAFRSEAEEAAALMYNFAAVPSGPGFVQSYYFTGYPAYEAYEKGGFWLPGEGVERRRRPLLRGS